MFIQLNIRKKKYFYKTKFVIYRRNIKTNVTITPTKNNLIRKTVLMKRESDKH